MKQDGRLSGFDVTMMSLDRRLGSGSMGEVFEGHRHRLLDVLAGDDPTSYTVKFLSNEGSEESKQRMEREADILSRISNRHIPRLRYYGRYRAGMRSGDQLYDGRVCIIMDYVPGETLASRIREYGQYDPLPALEITVGVLEALAGAHRAGVKHRDIKPSNIIVEGGRYLSDPRQVHVIDFGVAVDGISPSLTATGSTIGSFVYMSPERCRGNSAKPSDDLYALGIVLFDMLTGTLPFPREQHAGVITAQRVEQLLRERSLRTPKPSDVRIDGSIPEELDRICLKAMNMDESQRYQNCADFMKDVLDCIQMLHRSAGTQRMVVASDTDSNGTQMINDLGTVSMDAADESVGATAIQPVADGDLSVAAWSQDDGDGDTGVTLGMDIAHLIDGLGSAVAARDLKRCRNQVDTMIDSFRSDGVADAADALFRRVERMDEPGFDPFSLVTGYDIVVLGSDGPVTENQADAFAELSGLDRSVAGERLAFAPLTVHSFQHAPLGLREAVDMRVGLSRVGIDSLIQ